MDDRKTVLDEATPLPPRPRQRLKNLLTRQATFRILNAEPDFCLRNKPAPVVDATSRR